MTKSKFNINLMLYMVHYVYDMQTADNQGQHQPVQSPSKHNTAMLIPGTNILGKLAKTKSCEWVTVCAAV